MSLVGAASETGASGNTPPGSLPTAVRSNSVQVSLRVNVNVAGTVDVFTVAGDNIANVVTCTGTVPASDLYQDPSNAIFEFWEPSSNAPSGRHEIAGAVAKAGEQPLAGQTGTLLPFNAGLFGSLRTSLANAVVPGAVDAAAAAPFNTYGANANYTSYSSFGELALAAHAHYLFGHVAATAAIDNDEDLVDYFNTNDNNGSSASANIAYLLVNAILALSDAEASTIAQQVISQDPSRARGRDNNQLTPNVHQGLLFAAEDVIYMQVTIQEPTIIQGVDNETGDNIASTQMPAGNKFPATGAQFALRITLA
jgi:hypothetical protein